MTKTKKILAALLVALMVIAVLPVSVMAEDAANKIDCAQTEAHWQKVWAPLNEVEAEMLAAGATPAETTMAVYKAALVNPDIDEGSISDIDGNAFSFRTNGMCGGYDYKVRNVPHISSFTPEVVETVAEAAKVRAEASKSTNCPTSANVLLVGPYYGSDSSFTDQYKTEAASLATATGGTLTTLSGSSATGPAIASNYTDKGIVIYDSHGNCISSNNTSYLDLTSSTGLTSTDYSNGWAYNGGSFYGIDGRYIQNHASGTLSNCLVWMAICEGMKKEGKGTTGTALLAAGAAVVYGYSQSVSFTGDYKYEATFWTQMKNGATVAEAIATMKSTHGNWDPAYSSSSGAAWPIVMSATDSFPSNPDGTQTVTSDWTMFPNAEPVELVSFDVTNNDGNTITSATMAMGKNYGVKIAANPSNANNYTVAWSSANTNIATVTAASNGKTATITGVNTGSTTVTATVTTESKAVLTKTINVIVTEAPQWVPTNTITTGEEYLIGFVVNGTTYLAVNYNESASNHYYTSVSSNYYGYTAPATMNGSNVIGVSGNAEDLDYCTWIFNTATTGGYTIQSGYESGRYLVTYSSTSYGDLYPGTGTSYTWNYDASSHYLYRTISSTTVYAQYYTTGGVNYMRNNSTATNAYVQLFSLTATEDPTATPTAAPTATPTAAPTATPEPGTEVVYELVDAPVVGTRYIICSGSYAVGNTVYSSNHYLTAHSVTIDGNYVVVPSTLDVNTILYLCESGSASAGYTFKNVGNSMYMGLDSSEYLYPSSTAVAWLYENGDLNNQIDSEGYYYLALGSNSTYFTTSKNTNGLIKFYAEVVPEQPTEEPTATPTAAPTATPTAAPTEVPATEVPSGPSVYYYGEVVTVTDPVVDGTFYWRMGVSEGSGMTA